MNFKKVDFFYIFCYNYSYLFQELYMTIQNDFNNSIESNDIEEVEKLLNSPEVNPTYFFNLPIRIASELGYYEIVELLLKDSRVDPSDMDNYALRLSAENCHFDIVKLLMTHKLVDPSAFNNYAIMLSSKRKDYEMIDLLWSDKRVRDSLKISDLNLYNELIQKNSKEKIGNF